MLVRVLAVLAAIGLIGCGSDDSGDDDGGVEMINGCPTHRDPLPPMAGDTYATFAQPFFAQYCTRCHATTLSGDDRQGAPVGYNWDDAASVRDHQAQMRSAVGVRNFMPLNPPHPTCAERERLVRWIDADNP